MKKVTSKHANNQNVRCVATIIIGTVGTLLAPMVAQAQQAPGTVPNGAGSITQLKIASPAPAAATIGGTAPIPAYSPLTFAGVTLYGSLDVGFGYMSHGENLSNTFGPGLNELVSKDSGRARWGVVPNALSYSSIGLRGREPLAYGFSLVFDAGTTFLPTSGRLSNGLASLNSNSGVPLAHQSGNGDSSRDGQILNSVGFVGLGNKTLGTLTFGRQNNFDLDGVVAYDPLFASNAFSLIGFQGTTAGSGTTETARLNNTLKYVVNYGPIRTGVLYQFDDAPGKADKDGHGGGGAVQVDIGTTLGKLDMDAIFSHIDDAIQAGSLTAAQLPRLPTNSVSATIADETSIMLLAKYHFQRATVFAGYENMRYANPGNPVIAGSYDFGYQLSVVNNTAYTRNRLLQVAWFGGRYAVTKRLSLDSAFYYEHQNSYAANRCRNASLGSCSGALDVVSIVADYRLFKHFEIYAGAMLSTVNNGLASGYLNKSNVDPTIGGRFSF